MSRRFALDALEGRETSGEDPGGEAHFEWCGAGKGGQLAWCSEGDVKFMRGVDCHWQQRREAPGRKTARIASQGVRS